MAEARFFRGGIGMARNHRLIPMFDFFGRMLGGIVVNPIQNRFVLFELMDRFFKSVAVKFKKTEQMFVESNRLVVITIEQSFAMEFRLIDQAWKMNVAAEFFVRTARMQSSHGEKIRSRVTAALRPAALLTQTSSQLLSLPAIIRLE